MIEQIKEVPDNMVAFIAKGEITEQDFETVVMPKVDEIIKRENKLNYMLVLETSLSNFTFGAWLKDAVMGLKHFIKWNRAAIVTDVEGIKKFTRFFSLIMPGEFKAFEHKDLQQAIDWCSGKTGT